MNHKLFWQIVLTVLPFNLFSQQDPAITQFWNTYLYSNPATAGLFNRISANALFRSQWVGVTGSPVSTFANGSARIGAIHGGAGLSYLYENIGYNQSHTATASYAFRFQLAPGKCLSVGVAAGVKSFATSGNWIPPVTMNDVVLPHGVSKAAFDANFGLAYRDSNFRAGVSMTN